MVNQFFGAFGVYFGKQNVKKTFLFVFYLMYVLNTGISKTKNHSSNVFFVV